jgi:hypothetical protein
MMAIIGNFEFRLTAIISVYAPHNKLPKREKKNFYEELLVMLNDDKIIPKECEMRLIIGNWNAQIGNFDE